MKRVLILRACGSEGEPYECSSIKTQAELYNFKVDDYCPTTNDELIQYLNTGETYDYIYLSTHGNAEGFGNESAKIDMTWNDLGTELCNAACLNEDCIVLLSCCRGGLNQVAYELIRCCENVSYVMGPRQSLASHDMLISFSIFIHAVERKKIDPIVACEKIKAATDLRFICFDRLELETDINFINWCKRDLELDENTPLGEYLISGETQANIIVES